MATDDQQAKADRFLPRGDNSLEGARDKMRYLAEHTHIRIGVPLRQQIYALLGSDRAQQATGLTVQDVAQTLSLNSKTCAKVLDEMTERCEGLRATAHRYGRVYQYKYFVQQAAKADEDACVEDDEYTKSLSPQLYDELKAMDSETRQRCRRAMELSLRDKPQGNRMRVTHQNFIRALFIVHKLRSERVVSIHEMKVSIEHQLEPEIKWHLDKKTVLRIVWKLQRVGLIRQMCFRIALKKHSPRSVDYLGDDYESIKEDKRRQNGEANIVVYRVLVSLPEVYERDPEVMEHPLLTGKKSESSKATHYTTNVRSRTLKSAITAGNERSKALRLKGPDLPAEPMALLQIVIKKEEEAPKDAPEQDTGGLSEAQNDALQKSYRLFVIATFVFELYSKKLTNRYETLFTRLKSRPEVIALKRLLNRETKLPSNDPIAQYIQENPLKKRCLWSLNLPLVLASEESEPITSYAPPPVLVRGGRKTGYRELYATGKKLLLWLARHPGAKSLSLFEETAKTERQQAEDMLERLIDLRVIVRAEDGQLRLTKRGLPG